MVVTVKTFQVVSREAIYQANVDSLSADVNTFLAGLPAADVLDIIPTYTTNGKYGSHVFAITVVYLA